MKLCAKCGKLMDESKEKIAEIITKNKGKIIGGECFHFKCWKGHFEEAIQKETKQMKK